MCSLDTFKIDLKGLQEGKTQFRYNLDDGFFKAIDAPHVHRGSLVVKLSIYRTVDVFELHFHTEGSVRVPCDVCLDDMEVVIDTDNRLVARLATEYSEDDDLITVDENDGTIDVAWFIYEFIELALPIRHVHAAGECNPAMVELLNKHSATQSGETEEEHTSIDPRWAELKKLKIKDKKIEQNGTS